MQVAAAAAAVAAIAAIAAEAAVVLAAALCMAVPGQAETD